MSKVLPLETEGAFSCLIQDMLFEFFAEFKQLYKLHNIDSPFELIRSFTGGL